ncbi:siderophore-interacting protein [Curtobacterium sp. MCBD17_021]|uniref:siderophore-interacting protein n=1 Tax=Curtobacterium sp. MCBD17_021 TaxID=2175665 RepID=UPI001C64D918|nr:siderophore-interacting protein [Curtobacterium sp. MCBD17_021]
MAKIPRLMPENPRLFRARVVRTGRHTPSIHRVTIASDEIRDFPFLGFDHWFRLFLQRPEQDAFWMPDRRRQVVAAVPPHP